MIVPENIKNDKLSTLKFQRNQLLRDSDIYMISDFPITDYQRKLIKEYRQQLRHYFQLPAVKDWVFTLENQDPPVLPVFPDLNQIDILAAELLASPLEDASASFARDCGVFNSLFDLATDL